VTRRSSRQRNEFRDDLRGYRQRVNLVTEPGRDLTLGRARKHFGHGLSDGAEQLIVVEQARPAPMAARLRAL
jgi:hypothetical protein